MDKNIAIRLIQNVFQNPFDRDRFINFNKNLFNFLDTKNNFVYRGNLIPDAYKPFIITLERIGKYQDAEENKIDVLIVCLKKEHSIETARTMQRNFIAWYLSGSRGGELKDAALVAFYTDNPDDWRFSLVKMDYHIIESPNVRVKTKTELTPARRFSFLVGNHENSHTAQRQLLPILQDDKNNPLLSDLEKAFNIEVVTKEFFEKYKNLFLDVKDSIDHLIKRDQAIAGDFAAKGVDPVDFSKKLLGQVVFLYFLQKKGWFGVGRDDNWGTGPKNFLRLLLERMIVDYKNFFNDILEPLFYEALAKERDDDFYSRFNCKIPFLNGGLFDPIGGYDWVHTDILLPNELFTNQVRTKEGDTGTGILDIFDRYNFTVKEDEPLEKEVAVDPEMLGKVFENLLEVKDRKSKGTYYTPREIVHYMCQESLINYLINECGGGINKKDIETLVQYGESAVQHDSRVEQEGKETPTYSYKLPESIRKNAELIDERLKNIRVCDPAIGSGAFPVGMMNEIIRTRNTLTCYLKDKRDRSIYSFKRDAIQNSLYGVDIDPGAVEIAKLRLWLSLVVDEEDIKQIKPLPNLDYKIVCGNSLLSVNKQNLFVYHNLTQIEKLKEELFNETNTRKKQKYIEQIDKLIAEVTDNNKAFDFEIYFSEVYEYKDEKNKGFDIIIANPPYVGEKGHKEIFREIKRNALGKFYLRKMDLLYFFLHLALNIGKTNSQIAFITTNYYLTADGARKLRRDLKERSTIRELVNFNELKIFESALGQHNILTLLTKTNNTINNTNNKDNNVRTCITRRVGIATPEIILSIVGWDDTETDYYSYPVNELFEGNEFYIRIEGTNQNSDNPKQIIINKIKSQGYVLGSLCNVSQGLLTGVDKITNKHIAAGLIDAEDKNNGVFVLTKEEYINLNLLSSEKQLLKAFFKNSDIKRYYCNQTPSSYVLYLTRNLDLKYYPNLESHIRKFEKPIRARSKDRGEMQAALRLGKWWVIFAARDEKVFLGPKIISPQRSYKNTFAYNETEWFASADVYYITEKNSNIKLKYVLSLLNSKLFYLWFYLRGKKKGEMLELLYTPLMEVPIKRISEGEQEPLIEIVDIILSLTSAPDYLSNSEKQARVKDYENQIDQLVYKLYALSDREIKIVEGALKGKNEVY